MISIWKLIYDLEYWIQIGTGDDIIYCPDNRKEYQLIVDEFKGTKTPIEKISGKVLIRLKEQAEIVWFKRPMFWYLLKLTIKRWVL